MWILLFVFFSGLILCFESLFVEFFWFVFEVCCEGVVLVVEKVEE